MTDSNAGKSGYSAIVPVPIDFIRSRHEGAIRIQELKQQEFFHKHTKDLSYTRMFRGISSDEMESLINADPENSEDRSKIHLLVANTGDVIIEEGVKDENSFFVLIRGRAVVRNKGEEVAFLEPGDPVGHFAHFANIARTATVMTTSDDTLYLQFFSEALESEIQTGFRIYRNLGEALTGQFIDINRHAQKLWKFLEGSVPEHEADDCYLLARRVVEEIRKSVRKEGL